MDNDLTKRYYRIREVAELLDVAPSTLRYWESRFPQVRPMRNESGTRYYTPAQIENLRLVKYLLHDRGLRIEAAIEEMRTSPSGVARRQRAVMRLREIRDKLSAINDALAALR